MYNDFICDNLALLIEFLNSHTPHIPKCNVLYLGHKDGKWVVIYWESESETLDLGRGNSLELNLPPYEDVYYREELTNE